MTPCRNFVNTETQELGFKAQTDEPSQVELPVKGTGLRVLGFNGPRQLSAARLIKEDILEVDW